MRKVFAFLVVGSSLFAACAEDNPTIGATGATAATGARARRHRRHGGRLRGLQRRSLK